MSYDNRKALPANYSFIISDYSSGNKYTLIIEKEIARGSACIVYRGIQEDKVRNECVNRAVIIKEFYPKELDDQIGRMETMDLSIPEETQEMFDHLLDMFCAGQANHILYANDNADTSLPSLFISGEAHNTFYAVSNLVQGSVLSRTGITLNDALERAVSICDAVGRVHNGQEMTAYRRRLPEHSLYLDLKPENIYVNNNHIWLFDFNTVQPYRKITFYCCSEGWSAPEQELIQDRGYKDNSLIGMHTDIFSIGGILFYMLIGRAPSKEDLDRVQTGFDWANAITLPCAEGVLEDRTFISELDRVMKEILHPDPATRKINYGSLSATEKAKHEFEHLIQIADCVSSFRGLRETNASIIQAKDEILAFLRNKGEETKTEEQDTAPQDRYEGETQDGIPCGTGIYYLANGDRYEGTFRDGQPFGEVSYYYNKENNSVIEKITGQFNGFGFPSNGVIYYTNGDIYGGKLEEGQPHGRGLIFKNRSRYQGQFSKGKREGYGIMNCDNGDIFAGRFVDDAISDGTYYYQNTGDIYKGGFRNGLKEGKGTYFYSDGSKREAIFSVDKPDGYVARTDKDGSSIEEYYLSGAKVDFSNLKATDIDDPLFTALKIENELDMIKERKYSFTTKSMALDICSSIEKLIETEEGKLCLLPRVDRIKKKLMPCIGQYHDEAIRSGDIYLFETIKTINSVVDKLNTIQVKTWGWGPQRSLYISSEFVPYQTFNSFKNGGFQIKDERGFVKVKKHGGETFDSGLTEILPGERYDVRIYFNNNASTNLDERFGCAENVRISTNFTHVLQKGQKGKIWSVISSSNADPAEVWAQRYIQTSCEKLYLSYVPGTAVIHNNGAIDGMHISEDVFTKEGTNIGFNAFDGNIWGGPDFSGYIDYMIEAEEITGTIKQEVSYDGVNYQDSLVAAPNSDVYFRLTITNRGDRAITNATIFGMLSNGLTLVPGSVMMSANNSGVRDHLSDNYINNEHNLGRIETGNTVYIYYKCSVDKDMKQGDHIISSANLVYDNENNEGDRQSVITLIRVANGSISPWGPERKTFTMNKPAPYVTFNSITDNAGVGDERNFVRIREANAKDKFADEVKVATGKIYEVYIYYDNDASPSLGDKPKGIARDVRVSSSFPKVISATKKYTVTATISSSNAVPNAVWDGAYLTADEEVVLEYVADSLRLLSHTETHGQKLDADEMFSKNGVQISNRFDQPGIISSKDEEGSGYITYCILAKKNSDPEY